jgi:FMN phosphatase YigB (HAD superfamily)
MTMAVRGILFDFGEVLNASDERSAASAARAELAAEVGLRPEELWPYLFGGETARMWMTGKLSWDEFWAAVLQPLGIESPDEITAFARRALPDSETMNPDMVALIRELKDAYLLAVVSNATWSDEELAEILYRDGLLPDGAFDTVVTSSTVGVVKPEPGIYEEALARLDLAPAEAIFVDDMPKNVSGAVRLGIHGHVFQSPPVLRAYLAEMGVLPVPKPAS